MGVSLALGVEHWQGLCLSLDQQEGEAGIAFIVLDEDGKMVDVLACVLQDGEVTSRNAVLERSKLYRVVFRPITSLLVL